METKYASPERSSDEELKRQAELVNYHSTAEKFVNAVPDLVAVLNKNRQIVFANESLMKFLNINFEDLLGKRPGEALNCIHACEFEAGCGTSEFCRECGAVNAILESNKNNSSVKECRIIQMDNNALELLVWATKIIFEGEEFTIFSIKDEQAEKRRKALERIFFHDIMNTAGSLRGFTELLKDAPPEEIKEYTGMLFNLSDKLIEEINAQKQLVSAENSELEVNNTINSTSELVDNLILLFTRNDEIRGKMIEKSENFCDVKFVTDATLLRRALQNLIKNALEEIDTSQKAIIGCEVIENKNLIRFFVKNPGVIPIKIQRQIFQRSFSTKGKGRGLGTYSVKLLTENYLNGKVYFESNEESGTVFYVEVPVNL